MGEPLSHVEAILQNILGADNILVPPGSQVEEILQAIYYNTEYEKNPESRVAEILLAIKNKGIYDGPVLSRVEDILVHKLNNIPYTKHKKEDLSRVEQLLLDWLEQGGGEEIIEYTGTFPMTILANGEPLLDYIISGNTTQSGTPTPDNPVMPQGTGERTGNLWAGDVPQYRYAKDYKKYNPDNAVYIKAGTYTISSDGKLPNFQVFDDNHTQYSISEIMTFPGAYYSMWDGLSIGPISAAIHTATITILADCIITLTVVDNIGTYIMLNTGSTALPYEPYGYKIPISSANTTTPVYLGEVETTRKIRKWILTGNESLLAEGLNRGTYRYRVQRPTDKRDMLPNPDNCVCTHYEYTQMPYPVDPCITIPSNAFVRVFTLYETLEEFRAFLQEQYANGTPVTVWYVLANEETAVVNEPLMRIGDYSDTLSYAQAGVEIPTNKKPTETVIDVPTSVKPSEGYIKYTEPTDGPAPKTQVLGTKNHEIYMTSNDEVYVLRR